MIGFAVPRTAVTLWPEWAFAFAYLGKRVENRTWTIRPDLLPLPLLIHGGAYVGGSNTKAALEEGLDGLFHHAAAAGWGLDHTVARAKDGHNVFLSGRHEDGRVLRRTLVARRAIVAAVVIDRVDAIDPSPFVRPEDPWAVGPYGWRASRVVALREPVRCKTGKQGLWEISPSVFRKTSAVLSDSVLAAARDAAGAQTG